MLQYSARIWKAKSKYLPVIIAKEAIELFVNETKKIGTRIFKHFPFGTVV